MAIAKERIERSLARQFVIPLLVALFVTASAVVWLAGSRISHYASVVGMASAAIRRSRYGKRKAMADVTLVGAR